MTVVVAPREIPRCFSHVLLGHHGVPDTGGMLFECFANAKTAADGLARHLVLRAEPQSRGHWVCVREGRGEEVYRSLIDPGPTKSAQADDGGEKGRS